MIALAVALREHGLGVKFFSDIDLNPNPIERLCYKTASQIGVEINSSISEKSLISQINAVSVPIVLYNTDDNQGHISPLIGCESREIFLPYSEPEKMDIEEFVKRWNEKEIFRQCIVVSLVK